MLIGTVQGIWRYPVKSMAGEKLGQCAVETLGLPADRGWAVRDESSREITNGKRIPMLIQCAAVYREQPANGSIPQIDITFPDGSRIGSDDERVNARLTEVLGKQVTLWPRQPSTNKSHYRRSDPSARVMAPLMKIPGFRALLPKLTRLPNLNRALREVFSREPGEPIPDISVLPAEVLEFTSPLGTYFDAFPVNVLTSASLQAMAKFNPNAIWDARRFRPNFLVKTEGGLEGLIESTWAGKTLRIGTAEVKCEIPCARCGMTTHAQKNIPKDPSVLRSIVRDAEQNLGVYASVLKIGSVALGDRVELI